MKALTEQQVRDYRQNGFLFPIPALTPSEAAEGLNNINRLEARIGSPLPKAHKKFRQATYTFLPWVENMIHNVTGAAALLVSHRLATDREIEEAVAEVRAFEKQPDACAYFHWNRACAW